LRVRPGSTLKIAIVRLFAAGILFAPLCAAAQAGAVAQAGPASTSIQAQTDRDVLDARILMARKDYAGAAAIYERLAKQYPRDPSYPNFAGIAHLAQADLDGARKLFERSTKLDKHFAAGFHNLGAVWFSLKDYKRAVREYQRAVALDPNVAPYYAHLGYAFYNRGKLPEAMEMFRKAMALDPGVFEATGRDGPIVEDRTIVNKGLFYFTMAKSYAQLSDAMHCAVYLRRAFEEGYKEMAKARSDPAFMQVLASPDVQAILDEAAPLPVAPPNPPRPSA